MRPVQHAQVACGSLVPTQNPQKTIIVATLQGAKDVSSFYPGLKYLRHLACNAKKGTDRPRTTTHHHKTRKTRTRTQPTATKPTNRPTTTTRRKKKQVRERCLDVYAEQEERIEDVVRVPQAENTRGNPNPKRGLGFPSA